MKRGIATSFEHGFKSIMDLINVYLSNKTKIANSILLAITGGSCSGKSLLAQKLAQALKEAGIDVSVLNFDDYYKDQSQPDFPFDEAGRAIFDLPQSYLLAEFRNDVELLLAGLSINSPVYDKKTHRRLPGPGREVEAGSVVITEGLFVIGALNNLAGVINIFMETDDDIMIARRIKRDTDQLHNTPEETLRFIKERVEPYYLKHVAPQMEQANLVIINND